MKFSEFQYTRPDMGAVKADLCALTEALRTAPDYAAAKDVFLRSQTLEKQISTASNLVTIRHSINTRDPFYEAESTFFNTELPLLEEARQTWTAAMLESPFRAQFAKEYGDIVFLNAEIELRTFSPRIIPELQKENDLVQAYEKLLAGAAIPFEGKTYTIAQLAPFKQDPDDARRLAAWKAEGAWYKANQDELDRLYDELVRLRHTMGKKLGYDNYIPLGYDRMGRNCYDRNDVAAFRTAVQKYLVPVADAIFRARADRFGKQYPMSFADNAITFRSGEAKPIGTADEILQSAAAFFDALSPETGLFFHTMLDAELLDVLSTEGKRGGGYCTELLNYDVPFIFANFNGTRDDVETLVHEGGHAFAAWKNIRRIPIETIWPSMEGCEVHSMSMEFFSWPWAKLFFGKECEKFRYSHLAGALTFIPYGTMVDHFQHEVFAHPDWTPRQRHDCWKELLGIYMPWQKLDGDIPFYADGEGWQRQHHIYSFPFYYIDYCLAQTVALEFWAKAQTDFGGAWQQYLTYTSLGGSLTFTDLLKAAGLDSPFDEACLRAVCEQATQWLNAVDPACLV
ncbi:MAG: M3 family oligoendopeptidase [Clostridia bacterium]|nr:M3 family oligoendopeptidase [Clostridia bacterium]